MHDATDAGTVDGDARGSFAERPPGSEEVLRAPQVSAPLLAYGEREHNGPSQLHAHLDERSEHPHCHGQAASVVGDAGSDPTAVDRTYPIRCGPADHRVEVRGHDERGGAAGHGGGSRILDQNVSHLIELGP
jgi:hypothetical protein